MTKITEDSLSSFGEDSEEVRVRKFAKHMLKKSLFIGTFLEKRFVEPLNSYRDVVKVGDDEKELIDNLIAVRKRLIKFFPKTVWVGITEPRTIGAPAGFNLWVTLEEEIFGTYWYKIKNVDFQHNEVCLRLEVVRPLKKEGTPVSEVDSNQEQVDVGDKLRSYLENTAAQLLTIATFSNFKAATIFLCLLVSAIVTFLVEAVKYLLDFSLKFMRETSGFIKVCTPIIISLMKLVMNTVNGFYNLIAVMWRDSSRPKINQNVYQISAYDPRSPLYRSNAKALPYLSYDDFPGNRSPTSSVVITPLDD